MRFVILFLTAFSALLASSCISADERAISTMAVEHHGWDTLSVHVEISEHVRPFEDGQLTVFVFDASHDTLYVGPPGNIIIDDSMLGDEERLLVEACLNGAEGTECVQDGVRASPKRITLPEHALASFEGRQPSELRYELPFEVKRPVFGEEGTWEHIHATPNISAHVVASVEGASGAAVSVPVSHGPGRLDLSNASNFSDFEFQLRSRLMDGDAVAITYDVFASLGNVTPEHVGTHTFYARPPTKAEQLRDVEWFTEQAATQLIEQLELPDHFYADVFVDDWSFHQGMSRYEVELEIRWYRSRWVRRAQSVEGRLRVGADGTDPQFVVESGSRRGMMIWEEAYGTRTVDLDRLYAPEFRPRISEPAQTADTLPGGYTSDPREWPLRAGW